MGSQESACGNSGVDTRQDPPDSHELDDVEVELLLPSPPDIASNTSKPVVLADVQEKAILAAAEELVAAGHKALAIPCDVSDDVQVEAMVTRTVAEFGRLDAAFNNAGVMVRIAPTANSTPVDWDRVIGINLRAVWTCMRYELLQMERQGSGVIEKIKLTVCMIEIQWFAGERRRDQTKENDCPKHEDAIISGLAGPSKSVPRLALTFAGSSSCLYRAARDSHGRGESQNFETLEKWLREAREEDAMAERSKHIISSFDAALEVLKNDVLMMSSLTDQNFQTAIEALLNRDSELCNQVIADDEEVDSLEKTIDQEGVNLLLRFHPVASDMREVISAMKVSTNLERIADHAVTIARRAKRLNDRPLVREVHFLEPPYRLAVAIFRDSIRAYADADYDLAQTLKPMDRELDALTHDVTRKLVERATVDSELVPSYVDLVFVARALERIGDHATSIAEDSFWRDQATDIRHTYGSKKED